MFTIPYADVNPLVNRWLSGIQSALGDKIVGVYLHGSLAYGDFNPLTSDVDGVVITTDTLDEVLFAKLAEVHHELSTSGLPYATNMECSYIPQDAIRRFNPVNDYFPVLHTGGRFNREHHGINWVIQRHLIRRYAVPLIGEPIEGMIDPISGDDLRNAVRTLLKEWWQPLISDPDFLQADEYQVFGILTMCRALHTLETGDILTKPASAHWALGAHPQWASLIQSALDWQPPQPFGKLDQLQAMIAYTVARV